jgi:hypothetical protein
MGSPELTSPAQPSSPMSTLLIGAAAQLSSPGNRLLCFFECSNFFEKKYHSKEEWY